MPPDEESSKARSWLIYWHRFAAFGALAFLLFSFPTAASADDPNFSGKWRLNETRSDFVQLLHPPAHLLDVKHEGTLVRCQGTVKGDAKPYDCSFTTDGKELRLGSAAATRKTIAKWEGAALLLNIVIISQDSQRIEMDRWKLSRDGKSLSIRRQLTGPRGDREAMLQYIQE